jgi:hypothetical protein
MPAAGAVAEVDWRKECATVAASGPSAAMPTTATQNPVLAKRRLRELIACLPELQDRSAKDPAAEMRWPAAANGVAPRP